MTPTVASLAYQTPQQLSDQLRGTARRTASMSPLAATRIDDQIGRQVHALLDRDLVSVLAEGWQSSRALHELAVESSGHPNDLYTLDLASQQITHVMRPSFDLYVDRKRLATVGLTVTTKVLLPQLTARILAGALTGVAFAPGEVAVTISDNQGQQLVPTARSPIGGSHALVLPQRIPLLRQPSGGIVSSPPRRR